jgi:L-alanine-DL-glutamate epimerase-like enolase superfamily enzyme
MRIKKITTRVVSRRYETAFRNPHHPWNEKHAVLAFVETDGGALGVGEAWCDRGTTDSVVRMIDADLAPLAQGQLVSTPEQIWARMFTTEVMSVKGGALYSAMSAIDIAVWDAFAKSAGVPLYRLLGGYSSAVPVYGSSGLYAEGYGPDALGRDMAAAMASGCCGVKIKVAGAPIAEDVARVAAVRAAIGQSARLMVDALFAQDVPQAIRLGNALKPYDLWFYEAPTAREDVRGWIDVRNATHLPLSGPEMASGIDRFRDMLTAGAVDYLQADATVCGGITETRRIAALAKAFHRKLTMHASGSVVAFAANAHAAAAFDSGDSVEMHLLHQTLFDRAWAAGYAIRDGKLHLPDRPGLGIDLTPDDKALT